LRFICCLLFICSVPLCGRVLQAEKNADKTGVLVAKEPPQANEYYQDPENFFSIMLPPGWGLEERTLESAPNFRLTLIFKDQSRQAFRIGFLRVQVIRTSSVRLLHKEKNIPTLNRDDWKKHMMGQIKLDMDGVSFTNSTQETIGLPGYGKLYQQKSSRLQGKDMYANYYVIYQNRAYYYTLFYTVPEKVLSGVKESIEYSIKSFKPYKPFLGIAWDPPLIFATLCAIGIGLIGILVRIIKDRSKQRLEKYFEKCVGQGTDSTVLAPDVKNLEM